MVLDFIKNSIKKTFPITHNMRYDVQTFKIMKIVLENESTFIDVGCHKGEVMDQALKLAPNGRHFAYEPIPYLYEELKIKYKDNCVVKNYAISNNSGNTNFHHVVSNPAYSGIKKRSYPKEEKISKIKIKTTTLDDQLINENRVDLIKIDVEGGEFGVLSGAEKVIEKFHPVIIFEHGLGASEYYNTSSEDIFDFFENSKYSLFTLKGFISESTPLSKDKFNDLYHRNKEYYFLAMFKV